jgi:DNA-binding NtrC family response regulator
MTRGVDSQAVKTIKKFEVEVREIVRKALPRLVGRALSGQLKPKTIKDSKSMEQSWSKGDPLHHAYLTHPPKGLRYQGKHPLTHAVRKHGNKKAAARALGMAESTFRDRLKLEAARG